MNFNKIKGNSTNVTHTNHTIYEEPNIVNKNSFIIQCKQAMSQKGREDADETH